MEHHRGVASDAFTTHSSLILETYTLCNKIEQQFLKMLQFMDTNSVFLLKKNQQLFLVPLFFLQLFFRTLKSYQFLFSLFERQLFQRSEPLADISKRFVLSANMIGFSTFEVWCKSFTYSSFCMAVGWGCRQVRSNPFLNSLPFLYITKINILSELFNWIITLILKELVPNFQYQQIFQCHKRK